MSLRPRTPHALRRTLFAAAVFSAVPLLAACPEKKTPVIDAGLPPPMEDVQTTLIPMEPEEAGVDADADAKPVYKGPGVNTNVARLKQCCAQLGAEGKRMANSPEGGMFTAAAAQCNAIAAQAGPTGTAPEMGVIRNLLAGRTIPAACAGF